MKIPSMLKASSLLLITFPHLLDACGAEMERFAKYAPITPSTQGLTVPADPGYAVQDFGQGLYMITDAAYQSMFAVSTEGVILIDAPPSMLTKIPAAVANITSQPITNIVYSHFHKDHIGAASAFTNKRTVITAHDATKSLLQGVPHPTRPLPTVTFAQNHTLTVGNQTLELAYFGPNHIDGNTFIYAPAQKVLMVVDIIHIGWIPFDALAFAVDVPGYVRAQDQILSYDFRHFVGGHISRSGTAKDVRDSKAYVQDLFTNCNATLHLPDSNHDSLASITPDSLKVNPGNVNAPFKAYLDISAELCGNKTADKWVGRLGGADTFSTQNAYAVLLALMLDYD